MTDQVETSQERADTVFDELLNWIGEIETLTQTIKRRIDRATEKRDA